MAENMPAWLKNTGLQNTTISASPEKDPAKKATAGGSAMATEIINTLKAMSPEDRKSWAAALRAAKYDPPKSGVIGPRFVSAMAQFTMEAQAWQAQDPNATEADFLRIRQEEAGASGGSGGPSTRISTTISDDTTLRGLVQSVYADLTGRMPTEADIRKYTDSLRSAQKSNPTKTVYSADGTYATTTGGLNEEQYLFDQLVGSDQAKQKRALDAYSMIYQVMGGGA